MKCHLKYTIVTSCVLVLVGCSSISKKLNIHGKTEIFVAQELAHLPIDVSRSLPVEVLLALSDRNVYANELGLIKLLNRDQCPIEVTAHRRDFRFSESNKAAIYAANHNSFDSIKIDIVKLADGTWINFYDPYTVLTTDDHSGKRMKISQMNIDEYHGLGVQNKQTDELTDERPITALEVIRLFANSDNNGNKLNIEIKGKASQRDLFTIDNTLKKYLDPEQYHYSSMDPILLKRLREINPVVYLGFIQSPAPASITQDRKNLEIAASDDPHYQDRMKSIDFLANAGHPAYGYWSFYNYATREGLEKIYENLGANSGLHLDIRNFSKSPNIRKIADKMGMKIKTYSVNGARFHEEQLLKLKKKRYPLPYGIISDSSPYRICELLFDVSKPAISQRQYQTSLARYIASLPSDADLERITESLDYIDSNYYFNLDGNLRPIKSKSVEYTAKNNLLGPESDKDVDISLNYGKPIVIKVK